jgi:hypothetical protein
MRAVSALAAKVSLLPFCVLMHSFWLLLWLILPLAIGCSSFRRLLFHYFNCKSDEVRL